MEGCCNRSSFQPFLQPVDNAVLKHLHTCARCLSVELGIVGSASGLSGALTSPPLGWMRDRYSVIKIYVIGVGLSAVVSLLYAVAYSWQFIAFAILISGLAFSLSSCVVICDLSLPSRDRATGKALCEGVGALPALFASTIAAFLITWFGGINSEP